MDRIWKHLKATYRILEKLKSIVRKTKLIEDGKMGLFPPRIWLAKPSGSLRGKNGRFSDTSVTAARAKLASRSR